MKRRESFEVRQRKIKALHDTKNSKVHAINTQLDQLYKEAVRSGGVYSPTDCEAIANASHELRSILGGWRKARR